MAVNNINNEAKESFITRIINLSPESYVGCFDKKYIFWENGIQIAVTLTCPKTPIGGDEPAAVFAEIPSPTSEEPASRSEFTQQERDTLSKLMDALGI